MNTTTLVMSWRNTVDNQILWRTAIQRGWSVERMRGLQVPEIDTDRVVVYIESLLAPSLASQLGVELSLLTDDWLPQLPEKYRLRQVELTTLGDIVEADLPRFLKPPNEKSFPAKVYEKVDSLLADYGETTTVLSATPVEWVAEFRCFCLDSQVRTLSPYLRRGELSALDGFTATDEELRDAKHFAESVLNDQRVTVPRAVVLDVGIIEGFGWAVVEANAAWGSGIYGCDPNEVLDVLKQATTKCNERPND
ncbi:ATP-grasp domain-containing protein [Aeoliella mucimassa]|uniref:ATP-grasp domain-containing protein n=1 Tax=Aeoliella mucimassa TaxID=2527972 RepID=A0A518ARQ1_9BACT|nr:ATP-grasp domain-containing protein [Aeoliella mucimassa]QDU57397.1 hypothetical protein Pan181_36130 [Aeoliella mucimassa]